MTEWYDQRQSELDKRKQYLLEQLNKPRLQPDVQAAQDYYAKMAQQQKQQAVTVKQDDSKKKSLLDTLKGSIRQDAKDIYNSFQDGISFKDIASAAAKPLKYMTPQGNTIRGMIEGQNARETKQGGVAGFEARAGSNFTAGVGDLVKGTGDTARWLGNKFNSDTLTKAGEAVSDFGQKNLIDGYEQPYDKEFTWSALLDPNFYSSSVARTLPFTLSLIAPSIFGATLGAKAGGAVANFSKVGDFGQKMFRTAGAALGGSFVSVPAEAAFEAAQVYDEAIQKGLSPQEADRMAQKTFNGNLALLYGTQIPETGFTFAHLGGFKPSRLARAGLIGMSAGIEGGQEVGQEIISAHAKGEKANPAAMKEGFAVGALLGGVSSTIENVGSQHHGDTQAQEQHARSVLGDSDAKTIVRNNVRNRLSDELRAQVNDNRDALEADGNYSPEEIEDHLDNFIASTEEGDQLIEEETQRLVDRLQPSPAPSTGEAAETAPEAAPKAPEQPIYSAEEVADRMKTMPEDARQQMLAELQGAQTPEQTNQVLEQHLGPNTLRQDLASAMEQAVMEQAVMGTAQQQKPQNRRAKLEEQYGALGEKIRELEDANPKKNKKHIKQLLKQQDAVAKELDGIYEQLDGQPSPVAQQGEIKTPEEQLAAMNQVNQELQTRMEQVNQAANQADTMQQQVMGEQPQKSLEDRRKEHEAKRNEQKATEAQAEPANPEAKSEEFPVGSKVFVKGINREMTVVDNSDPNRLKVKGTGQPMNVWRNAVRLLNEGEAIQSIQTEEEPETQPKKQEKNEENTVKTEEENLDFQAGDWVYNHASKTVGKVLGLVNDKNWYKGETVVSIALHGTGQQMYWLPNQIEKVTLDTLEKWKETYKDEPEKLKYINRSYNTIKSVDRLTQKQDAPEEKPPKATGKKEEKPTSSNDWKNKGNDYLKQFGYQIGDIVTIHTPAEGKRAESFITGVIVDGHKSGIYDNAQVRFPSEMYGDNSLWVEFKNLKHATLADLEKEFAKAEKNYKPWPNSGKGPARDKLVSEADQKLEGFRKLIASLKKEPEAKKEETKPSKTESPKEPVQEVNSHGIKWEDIKVGTDVQATGGEWFRVTGEDKGSRAMHSWGVKVTRYNGHDTPLQMLFGNITAVRPSEEPKVNQEQPKLSKKDQKLVVLLEKAWENPKERGYFENMWPYGPDIVLGTLRVAGVEYPYDMSQEEYRHKWVKVKGGSYELGKPLQAAVLKKFDEKHGVAETEAPKEENTPKSIKPLGVIDKTQPLPKVDYKETKSHIKATFKPIERFGQTTETKTLVFPKGKNGKEYNDMIRLPKGASVADINDWMGIEFYQEGVTSQQLIATFNIMNKLNGQSASEYQKEQEHRNEQFKWMQTLKTGDKVWNTSQKVMGVLHRDPSPNVNFVSVNYEGRLPHQGLDQWASNGIEPYTGQDKKNGNEAPAPNTNEKQKKIVNPLPEDPSKVEPKHFNEYVKVMKKLVDAYRAGVLYKNLPTTQKGLREIATDILGRPVQEDEWNDALEAAIQLASFRNRSANPEWTLKEKIEDGQKMEALMKIAGRSMEKTERQQFSTPIPLASIVRSLVPYQANLSMRESSAGTGSLVSQFIDFSHDVKILANDLSPRRAAILQATINDVTTKPVTISNKNAFELSNDSKYDLIIGNPPFKGQNKGGGTVEMNGKPPWKGSWGDLGNRFLAWDLRALKDGGRLVYVVSGGVIDNQQNREFRKWLKDNHTVLAMVKFPAGVYDSRGTKWPTGLIVVEKGKVANAPAAITGEYETLDSLLDALAPLNEASKQEEKAPAPNTNNNKQEPPANVQPNKYDKVRQSAPMTRLDRLAAKADQYLKDNKDRMNSLPLDLYAAAAIVGANKIAHGVVDFAEWSEQMTKEYGSKLRLSLRSLYVQSEDIANFSDADLDEYLGSVGLDHLEEEKAQIVSQKNGREYEIGKEYPSTNNGYSKILSADENNVIVEQKAYDTYWEGKDWYAYRTYEVPREEFEKASFNIFGSFKGFKVLSEKWERPDWHESAYGKKETTPAEETKTKSDLELELKLMYQDTVADGTKPANKVKKLEKAKAWAEENGVEWLDSYETYLNRVREAADSQKQQKAEQKAKDKAEGKVPEVSEATQKKRDKKMREEFKKEIDRQKSISTLNEAIDEFTRRYKNDSQLNKQVAEILSDNEYHSRPNMNGFPVLSKEEAFKKVESRISYIWQDVHDLVSANSESAGELFLTAARNGLLKDAFVDVWERKGVIARETVGSNESNGNTGAGNRQENADVRGAESKREPAAGSETSSKQPSGSGREGTSGTGTVHGQTDVTEPSGTVHGSTSSFDAEQGSVSSNVPAETKRTDRGDTSGAERKKADSPTANNVPSDTRYVPGRLVTGIEHMGNVTEAPNMRFVKLPEEMYDDKYLPHEIVVKGGKWKLSDVQIETVMAAKYNFDMGKRGILLADDTGMGKTAQQLGIAADAWHSGRTKRILVVTTKDQVATSSFIPENENLGFKLPITWMSPNNKEYNQQHGKTWRDSDFAKDGINNTKEYTPFQVGDGVIVMSKTTFRDAQESVVAWLNGTDGDVTILMDESHEFANRESGLGQANVRIFEQFRDKAQYVYSSATAAEDIEGLEHLYGLHKWGVDGFGDFKLRLTSADSTARSGKKKKGMAAAFDRNGKSPFKREVPLTMMEQITRELKMDGQYIGRQLSLEGVSMEGLPIKVSSKEIGDWNRAVQFIGMIAQKAEMYGRSKDGETNPKARGQIISQVVGYMRRLSGYYRMKAVIADIQKQMESGDSKRFGIIGEFKSGDDGQPANLFAAINAINTQDPVDTGDDIIYSDIPEAIEDKAFLLSILRGENPEWGEEPVPSIPSPSQMLYDAFGEENVAIVSGDVKQSERPKVVKEFQDMKKNVIWFNSAGGTGVNMHDTVGTPIRVYTQDYPYNAKAQKQAEGRFNRTGQVTKPTYVYPYLNSSTDTKFVGTLIARYEAMGALSRGDVGKLGGDELSNFDMTGEAAEVATLRVIPELDADVRAEMFGEFTRDIDFSAEGDETAAASVFSGNAPEVKKFLNALMFLDYEASSQVFNQFTEKIQEVERELEEKGGVKDKFETYKGKELETQVGKNGIRLRKIKTLLSKNQERSLAYELKKAQENEAAMEVEYEKTREETLSKLEKQIEEMTAKQNENRDEQQKQTVAHHELMRKFRTGDAKEADLVRARNKMDALTNEFNRRAERLKETQMKLKGLQDGIEVIIDKISDMRRAQVRKNNARLFRLGAEANIERSQDILLVDGKIATNGLLVNIRQAIRKAANRVYGERNTPASALTLELRGYSLENGERAIGAVVPKWAEGDVASALEARMSYTGKRDDIAELMDYIKAGNKVSLQGGFELEYHPKLQKIRINGMTVSEHRDLFKSLNKDGNIVAYNPVNRSFTLETVEGMKKFIEKYPILEKKTENAKSEKSTTATETRTTGENTSERGKTTDSPTTPHKRRIVEFGNVGTVEKVTVEGKDYWTVRASVPPKEWGKFKALFERHGGEYHNKGDKVKEFQTKIVFSEYPESFFEKEGSNAFALGSDKMQHEVSPKTAQQVSHRIAKALNTVLRPGNVGKRNALASFNDHKYAGNVKNKWMHNLRVTAHELGHAFEERGFTGDRSELLRVGEAFYPAWDELKTNAKKMAEGRAELFTLYILDRDQAAAMAPKSVADIERVASQDKVVEKVFQDVQKIMEKERNKGDFEKAIGSIAFPSDKRIGRTIGDEYQLRAVPEGLNWAETKLHEIKGFMKEKITRVQNFKVPFQDMQKTLNAQNYQGKDIVKMLAVTGNAEHNARHTFDGWATDHRGRYIVRYETTDAVPDYLTGLHGELDGLDPRKITDKQKERETIARYAREYKNFIKDGMSHSEAKEKAILEALSSRSLRETAEDGMMRIAEAIHEKTLPRDIQEQVANIKIEKTNKESTEYLLFSGIIQAYRANERYSRLDEEGNQKFKEVYMDEAMAARIVDKVSKEMPELEHLIKEYTTNLSNIILTKLVEAGVETQEARDRVENASDFYIPTYYAEKAGHFNGDAAERKTAGKPIRGFKGRNAIAIDFLRATTYKLLEVEQSIEFKRVLDEVENGISQKSMGLYGEIISPTLVPKLIDGGKISKQVSQTLESILGDTGVNIDQIEGSIADTIFTTFFPLELSKQKVLMNWHEDPNNPGQQKRVYIRLAPDLYNSIVSLKPMQVRGLFRMVAKFSSFTRKLALSSPHYIMNVLSRDLFESGIQQNTNQNFIKGYMKGALLAAGKDPKLTDQYIASGAFMSAQENILESFKRANITDGLIDTKVKGWKKTKAGKFVHILTPHKVLEWQEQIARYGVWEAKAKELAGDYGIDPKKIFDGRETLTENEQEKMERILLELGYEASEVTTNFRTHGTSEGWRKAIMPVTFLSGTLNGLNREGREFQTNPKRMFKRIATTMLPLTILSWVLRQLLDQDDKDDLPSEMLDKYWVFPVGNMYHAISKPFGYGIPLAYVERMLDAVGGGEAARDWNEDMFYPFKHNFSLPYLPIVGQTALELAMNESWYGGKIVGNEKASKFTQINSKTSKLAEMQAKAEFGLFGTEKMVVSPAKFDYAVRGIFGYPGQLASNLIDKAAGKDKTILDPSQVNVYSKDKIGSRFTDKFYNKLDDAETEYDRQVLNGEVEKGKPTEKVKAYRELQKYLADMRKLKEVAKTEEGLTTQERMELDRQISKAMKDVSRYGNGQEITDRENLDQVVSWVERYRKTK